MIDSKHYNLEEILFFIADNNRDEQEAIRNYSQFIDILNHVDFEIMEEKEYIFQQAIDEVREYISEEMKHSKGLSELYTKLSGIIAED